MFDLSERILIYLAWYILLHLGTSWWPRPAAPRHRSQRWWSRSCCNDELSILRSGRSKDKLLWTWKTRLPKSHLPEHRRLMAFGCNSILWWEHPSLWCHTCLSWWCWTFHLLLHSLCEFLHTSCSLPQRGWGHCFAFLPPIHRWSLG